MSFVFSAKSAAYFLRRNLCDDFTIIECSVVILSAHSSDNRAIRRIHNAILHEIYNGAVFYNSE